LHPQLKTVYLRQHGWGEEQIQTLVKYCRKIWDMSYKQLNKRSAKIAVSAHVDGLFC
ncbi:hypothetical protein SISSUDRAFT_992647, partial [Sistotremastrum suecicum HHB10207 ss-3]